MGVLEFKNQMSYRIEQKQNYNYIIHWHQSIHPGVSLLIDDRRHEHE